MNKKLLLSIALGMQLTIGYAQGFKNPVLLVCLYFIVRTW